MDYAVDMPAVFGRTPVNRMTGALPMPYVDGFVAAIPITNRAAFLDHARLTASLFREFGARRVVDSFGDDVPAGSGGDFYRAVDAQPGEAIGFSFVEYPDKASRDSAGATMMADPRVENLPDMPFDGKRMIIGGFDVVCEEGSSGDAKYIDCFVTAMPSSSKTAFAELARKASALSLEHGAIHHVDSWGDDIMRGTITDFWRAANASDQETVVLSWIEWPDKRVRDENITQLISARKSVFGSNPKTLNDRLTLCGGFEVIHLDVNE